MTKNIFCPAVKNRHLNTEYIRPKMSVFSAAYEKNKIYILQSKQRGHRSTGGAGMFPLCLGSKQIA